MSEVQRISRLLKHGYDGQPWYGTALSKLLADVTAEQAAVKPFPKLHSIWQEVLHAIAWRKATLRMLSGEPFSGLSDAENWPEPSNCDAAAWKTTLGELAQTQIELQTALADLTDERLTEKPGDKPFTLYVLLHGIIHHDVYHAGQIALLRHLSAVR
jgi:uncharacterized damage-inducible protein DinB